MYTLKIADYTFGFRDLTWLDEVGASGYVEILSRVTTQISKGQALVNLAGPQDVVQVLNAFPQDIREKMWRIYLGQLPKDRFWTLSEDLWEPPEPTSNVDIIELEDEPDEQ